jgi:hypothetical protein
MNWHRADLLAVQMDEAWDPLSRRLSGVTDEEFMWEPVPGCWTVRQLETGRWLPDYLDKPGEPPPFTTLGWRILHLASCKLMYHEYAFGPGRLSWDELDYPHSAAAAVEWLSEGHERLRSTLDSLKDEDLDTMRLTNWGEKWPTWRIFWTMISHDLHHGAEIGCLRDLYLHCGGRPLS